MKTINMSVWTTITLIVLFGFFSLVDVAEVVPYIQTRHWLAFKWWVIYPSLQIALLFAFAIGIRKKGLKSSISEITAGVPVIAKILNVFVFVFMSPVVFVFCVVLISAEGLVAGPTNLFARDRYAAEFTVVDVTGRGRAGRYEVALRKSEDGELVYIRATRDLFDRNVLEPGRKVCVIGRAWFLGALATTITDDISRCRRG